MKFQTIKVSVALAATAVSLVGFTSIARAGEGGVAGAAAFTVTGDGAVSGVAVSAAVGKQDAAAAAFNYASDQTDRVANSAFALGSGGVITTGGLGTPSSATLAGSKDEALADKQGNSFTQGFSIQIGTGDKDSVVTAPVNTAADTNNVVQPQ